jgi:hypothetical protein
MKKLYTLLLLLIVSGALFAQASDSFLYTGALKDNGWGSQSGITGQMTTLTGSLTYPGVTSLGNKTQIVAGNTEDINLPSAAPITGVAYYSALINLPNITGLAANTTTGNYLLMFGTLSSTIPPTWTVFSGRLYIKAGTAANTFSLGVLNGSGGTAAPTFSTTDYSINTTYIVVVKFDLAINTASLFVNPTLGTTEGTPTVTNATGTSAAPAQINGFIIREAGNATAGTGNVQIDEVKFGSTWDSVTLSTPTTTPSASAQSFCNSATVSDLVAFGATGATFSWYDVATGGTALTPSTALATGTYYVSQTVAGTESARTSVAVTINVTAAPTATAQTFCGSKTVANLVATGTALKWYVDTIATTALVSTDPITTGTYYVSQTLNACESTRNSVAVTVNTTAAPTASAQTFCGSKTVADLVANGTALNWYADNTTTTVLASTTTLATGTFYVSQTLNACESTRTSVAVTVNTTAAPTASAQTFCGSKTVADLVATGTALNWYADATTTTALASTATLATGTYYVSQTLAACESTRTSVAVTVNTTAAPTASAQTFCGSKTVADLVASGTALHWYADNTTSTVLASTSTLASGTYYVSQTLAACESTRTSVAVTVNVTAVPTGNSTQTFTVSTITDATIANLVVNPSNVIWYATMIDAMSGTNPLVSTTMLSNGTTYYAVNVVNGCPSTPLALTVTVNLGTDTFDSLTFSFYPNPTSGILNISYSKEISQINVVNLVGQTILTKSTNASEVQINLSSLANATYFVKVVSEGKIKTFKVVKGL